MNEIKASLENLTDDEKKQLYEFVRNVNDCITGFQKQKEREVKDDDN